MKTLSQIEAEYLGREGDCKIPEYPALHTIPASGIIDEEMSVRWNREECKRLENVNQSLEGGWISASQCQDAQLRESVVSALVNEYPISEKIAKHVESFTFVEVGCFFTSIYFSKIKTNAEFAAKIISVCKTGG